MATYTQETRAPYFDGFQLPDHSTNGEITMPANWPEVAKAIDNIAELKVVQIVLWVTWGNGQPDVLIPLSIDDFVEVTGLCKRSVANGIQKALEHGYIHRQNLCYYGINLAHREEQDVPNDMDESMQDFPECPYLASDETQDLPDENFALMDESAFEALSDENANFASSSNNSNNIPINNCNRSLRIQSLETLPEEVYSNKPDRAKENYPEFIRAVLKYLSVELGDGEHIAPNIAQATRIYKQSGMSEDDFTKLLYDLESVARYKRAIKRVNSQGQPNRMPYYFACLKKSVTVTNNC